MKKFTIICCAVLMCIACNNSTEPATSNVDSAARDADHTRTQEGLDTAAIPKDSATRVGADKIAH